MEIESTFLPGYKDCIGQEVITGEYPDICIKHLDEITENVSLVYEE